MRPDLTRQLLPCPDRSDAAGAQDRGSCIVFSLELKTIKTFRKIKSTINKKLRFNFSACRRAARHFSSIRPLPRWEQRMWRNREMPRRERDRPDQRPVHRSVMPTNRCSLWQPLSIPNKRLLSGINCFNLSIEQTAFFVVRNLILELLDNIRAETAAGTQFSYNASINTDSSISQISTFASRSSLIIMQASDVDNQRCKSIKIHHVIFSQRRLCEAKYHIANCDLITIRELIELRKTRLFWSSIRFVDGRKSYFPSYKD